MLNPVISFNGTSVGGDFSAPKGAALDLTNITVNGKADLRGCVLVQEFMDGARFGKIVVDQTTEYLSSNGLVLEEPSIVKGKDGFQRFVFGS